uniref:Uncharacterized protein n=1 Tax=Ditylenchus dipsaci TaxID=166011 RepID=A0A915EUE9_9BILA
MIQCLLAATMWIMWEEKNLAELMTEIGFGLNQDCGRRKNPSLRLNKECQKIGFKNTKKSCDTISRVAKKENKKHNTKTLKDNIFDVCSASLKDCPKTAEELTQALHPAGLQDRGFNVGKHL